MTLKAKIHGCFGGTFDPVHIGHRKIAEAVLRSGKCDDIILLPAFVPPHKLGRKITPFENRLAMLELEFSEVGKVMISDLENRLKFNPSYTIDVMRELRKNFPADDKFKLIIGGDSLNELHTWHRAEELAEEYDFIIYPRSGVTPDYDGLEKIWGKKIAEKLTKELLELPFYEISSTILRKKLEKGENTANFISDKVEHYINEKKIYFKG